MRTFRCNPYLLLLCGLLAICCTILGHDWHREHILRLKAEVECRRLSSELEKIKHRPVASERIEKQTAPAPPVVPEVQPDPPPVRPTAKPAIQKRVEKDAALRRLLEKHHDEVDKLRKAWHPEKLSTDPPS